MRLRSSIVVVLLSALTLVACSSSKSSSSGSSSSSSAASSGSAAPSSASSSATSAAPSGGLTASFRGVTPTTIKLGIVTVDYTCIKQFVDYNFGNQPEIDQVFINELNAQGGVLGRKIVPVFKSYCPIGNTQALTLCTSFTEDDKVFAVLGVFIDFTGDAQLCLSRDHQTIHIGHELLQQWISQAPPGLLMTPDITAERRTTVLMNLLKTQGTLTGKKVATLADQDSAASVASVVKPALDAMGIAQGSSAVLTIPPSGDTSASLAQLQSFTEKWKGEGVNAVFLGGLNVSSKAYVFAIKAAMPNVLLLTDGESAAQEAGQDATAAKVTPNPYSGMLTANGQTDEEQFESANVQQCVKEYQSGGGTQQVVGPTQLQPGPDGKRAEVWEAVRDFCGELQMFTEIAEKAGPDLTNATWTQAVNNYGEIKLAASVYASLHTGKYDADDGFRLVTFDPTEGAKGDWRSLTPIQDASK